MEKLPEKKFSSEHEKKLAEVLQMGTNLEKTAGLDKARIEWLMKIAELFEEMKMSREKLKEELEQTARLDNARIEWWLGQAEKYKKQKPKESNQ